MDKEEKLKKLSGFLEILDEYVGKIQLEPNFYEWGINRDYEKGAMVVWRGEGPCICQLQKKVWEAEIAVSSWTTSNPEYTSLSSKLLRYATAYEVAAYRELQPKSDTILRLRPDSSVLKGPVFEGHLGLL